MTKVNENKEKQENEVITITDDRNKKEPPATQPQQPKKYKKRIIRHTANGGFFETEVEVIENEVYEEENDN